jgi:hypothetical protein
MYGELLYARPSFLTGVARLFDFWGLFDAYNTSPDPETADSRAIGADWRSVGDDIRRAMRSYQEELHSGQLELFSQNANEQA